MSAGNFAPSLALTLGYEGGYSAHLRDPGGATMCGITQAVYDDDRERRALPRQSVRLSTTAERESIYRWRYWLTIHGDELPPGVDYALFDFAVNSGVARAAKTLQRVIDVNPDGLIGPTTRSAVNRYCARYKPDALSDALCEARLRFLEALPTFTTFGEGWTYRVMGRHDGPQSTDTGVIDRAFDMARGVAFVSPARQQPTVKTYLARAA
jgi:lysozyme family protein